MKAFLFYIMSTFRWLIVTSSNIVCALMIFALIFSFTNNTSNQTGNLIITFLIAVLFGAFSWYYNVLLKKLTPKDSASETE
jgi:dolichyl-phosphate-mannose--protein O-mannosyl transferase